MTQIISPLECGVEFFKPSDQRLQQLGVAAAPAAVLDIAWTKTSQMYTLSKVTTCLSAAGSKLFVGKDGKGGK